MHSVSSDGSTFKIPPRSTLNDAKREAWMLDLKKIDEPLHKLLRNAPIGYRGDKILDILSEREIPLQRASWYIKIVRLNEIVGVFVI